MSPRCRNSSATCEAISGSLGFGGRQSAPDGASLFGAEWLRLASCLFKIRRPQVPQRCLGLLGSCLSMLFILRDRGGEFLFVHQLSDQRVAQLFA